MVIMEAVILNCMEFLSLDYLAKHTIPAHSKLNAIATDSLPWQLLANVLVSSSAYTGYN